MPTETMTPPTVSGVTPYINVEGASEASAFYQKAFGAKELMRIPADDGKRLMHCHLEINGGPLLMSDTWPDEGHPWEPSKSFTMHLQVDDIDAWWTRALDAGATVGTPVAVTFWGDKYGTLRDPFGVNWSLGQTPKSA